MDKDLKRCSQKFKGLQNSDDCFDNSKHDKNAKKGISIIMYHVKKDGGPTE